MALEYSKDELESLVNVSNYLNDTNYKIVELSINGMSILMNNIIIGVIYELKNCYKIRTLDGYFDDVLFINKKEAFKNLIEYFGVK